MIRFITELTDTLLSFIKDDPVRPEIPTDYRVTNNRFVAALVDDQNPSAMVCVSLHEDVPDSVLALNNTSLYPTTAVFYTIWSYEPGAGRELLFNTVSEIKLKYPTVNRFVTLSPKTEMARKFHLKNGAIVFRENSDSVNYEYLNN
jgi:hypothetical protein